MATIRAIASAADVSIATVSRVLNNGDSREPRPPAARARRRQVAWLQRNAKLDDQLHRPGLHRTFVRSAPLTTSRVLEGMSSAADGAGILIGRHAASIQPPAAARRGTALAARGILPPSCARTPTHAICAELVDEGIPVDRRRRLF